MHVDTAARELCCKLVYCGPALAGKTTNLERIYLDAPADRRGKLSSIATEGERTLFFDYMPLDLGVIKGLRVKLSIYTVPGQALYVTTRRMVLQGVDGLVFVADSDPKRIEENVSALAELERLMPAIRGRELQDLPFAFQWNKQDLPGALDPEALNDRLNSWGGIAVEAVASEGQGVLETLRRITQATLKDCRARVGLSSSVAEGRIQRRTTGRLRRLRAERVAELCPSVQAVPAGAPSTQVANGTPVRSSEEQTLPYGRGRGEPPQTPAPAAPTRSTGEIDTKGQQQKKVRKPGWTSRKSRKKKGRRRADPEAPTTRPLRTPIPPQRLKPRRQTAKLKPGAVGLRRGPTFEVQVPPPPPSLRQGEPPRLRRPKPKPPAADSVSRDELCPWGSVSQILPPRIDPVIGREIGPWRIHAKLGEGGMGAVYLARHPQLRKEVVVKVLKPELAHRPQRVERFLREARLGARLSHPNLVSVQDVGTTRCGLHYMVMEYVEGVNLHERTEIQGAQDPPEALRIVREVAKALAALHAEGVIHRDVKTENVVITPAGEVKLIDFGLAKDLSDSEALTLPGALIGTPVYMAPEIGRVREVDHRVDIYSLGLTWYCLLTGERPFAGEDVHRVILGKVPLPRPRASTGDALDPGTQNVLARMLAWHREERHPTMAAVLSDLAALAKGDSSSAISAPDRWALTRPKKARKARPPVRVEVPQVPETDPRLLLLILIQLGISLVAVLLASLALLLS